MFSKPDRAVRALEKILGRQFTAGELATCYVIPLPSARLVRVVSGALASSLRLSYDSVSLDALRRQLELGLSHLTAHRLRVQEGSSFLTVFHDGHDSGTPWLHVRDYDCADLGVFMAPAGRPLPGTEFHGINGAALGR